MNKMSFTLSSKEQTKKFNLHSEEGWLHIKWVEVTLPQKDLDSLSRLIMNYSIEFELSRKDTNGKYLHKIPLVFHPNTQNATIELDYEIENIKCLDGKYFDYLSIQLKPEPDLKCEEIELLVHCTGLDIQLNSSL